MTSIEQFEQGKFLAIKPKQIFKCRHCVAAPIHNCTLYWRRRLLLLLLSLPPLLPLQTYFRLWFPWFCGKTSTTKASTLGTTTRWERDYANSFIITAGSCVCECPICVRFGDYLRLRQQHTHLYLFYIWLNEFSTNADCSKTELCHGEIEFAFIKRRTVHCWNSHNIYFYMTFVRMPKYTTLRTLHTQQQQHTNSRNTKDVTAISYIHNPHGASNYIAYVESSTQAKLHTMALFFNKKNWLSLHVEYLNVSV